MTDQSTRPQPSAEPVDDLIERLREVVTNRPDSLGICTAWQRNPDGPEAADRIAALEADNARLLGLVGEAGEALSNYACHAGPDIPCIRSKFQCLADCGKVAGDALAKIKEATDGRVTD